jgi:hypothetical protein
VRVQHGAPGNAFCHALLPPGLWSVRCAIANHGETPFLDSSFVVVGAISWRDLLRGGSRVPGLPLLYGGCLVRGRLAVLNVRRETSDHLGKGSRATDHCLPRMWLFPSGQHVRAMPRMRDEDEKETGLVLPLTRAAQACGAGVFADVRARNGGRVRPPYMSGRRGEYLRNPQIGPRAASSPPPSP